MFLLKFIGKEINHYKCDQFNVSRGNHVWVDKEHWKEIQEDSLLKKEFIKIKEKKGKVPEVQTIMPGKPFVNKKGA